MLICAIDRNIMPSKPVKPLRYHVLSALATKQTWETLSEVHDSETDLVTLPDPKLFIISNGDLFQLKIRLCRVVVWQILVDVKLAIHKPAEGNKLAIWIINL